MVVSVEGDTVTFAFTAGAGVTGMSVSGRQVGLGRGLASMLRTAPPADAQQLVTETDLPRLEDILRAMYTDGERAFVSLSEEDPDAELVRLRA